MDRPFNHDILITVDENSRSQAEWPLVAHAFYNAKVGDAFGKDEANAKRLKRVVQRLGTTAIAFALVALLGSALELHLAARPGGELPTPAAKAIEACGLLGLVAAFLASRFWKFRREWLKSRFFCECLRQWQFRRTLDGVAIERAAASPAARTDYEHARDAAFGYFVADLTREVGQRLGELADSAVDPVALPFEPHAPADPAVAAQLASAYFHFRLDHQINYAVYKLSADDKTFAGVSGELLVKATDMLAAASLVGALAVSVVQLFHALPFGGFAGVGLAIFGVAVRAWRDGMALDEERERYQDMRQRLQSLAARWADAPDDPARLRLAEEVERAGLEELRSFVRQHGKAQFLL